MSNFRCYRITSDSGLCAEICEYGARLTRLEVPARYGRKTDVVLGFDSAPQYARDHGTYFGATIGRVANRIGNGEFTLDGTRYALCKNDGGKHHLHGGLAGFDKRVWRLASTACDFLRFVYVSADGEEGYPGKLTASVTYKLLDDALEISYQCSSTRDTLCSLTNHSYFNLDGDGVSALDHEIFIDADSLCKVDDGLIPTGERLDLTLPENAAYSFLTPHALGLHIGEGGQLMRVANGGYDFSYNFAGGADFSKPRATAYSARTGIKMSVYTDLPAMQFYSGNFLDGFAGKGGRAYQKHAAFCMETQCDISDPAARVLRAGEVYRTVTRYAFQTL